MLMSIFSRRLRNWLDSSSSRIIGLDFENVWIRGVVRND